MKSEFFEYISPEYREHSDTIREAVAGFSRLGRRLGNTERNEVRHISYEGLELNIKSFRIPHLINRFVYRYLRKSKARRSFEHASYLVSRNVDTPGPVAYFEERRPLALRRSYYVSVQVREDFSFRTLIDNPDLPGREEILRQFTGRMEAKMGRYTGC